MRPDTSPRPAPLPGAGPATPPADPRAALLQDSNFRWMIGGSALSMLGDQFTLIALPWLVLQMTGDTLVLGTVLAAVSTLLRGESAPDYPELVAGHILMGMGVSFQEARTIANRALPELHLTQV